jgi:hypothetical protein
VDTTAGYDFLRYLRSKKLKSVWVLFSMVTELGCFFNCKTTRLNRASHVTLRDFEPAGIGTVSGSCNSQLTVFATELQREFQLAVAFSISCFKHTSV